MKKFNLCVLVFVFCAILTGLTTIAISANSGETLIIDGKEIEKGTKKSWRMIAGETVLGPVSVPITVINGRKDGPVLAVTAACHPTEVTGVMASILLAKEIDPEKLAGTLLIVHVQNVMGFIFQTKYINPLDYINFSWAFPLEEFGDIVVQEPNVIYHQGTSLSHYIAEKIGSEIISRADYHVDCHGGTIHEDLVPNIEIGTTGNPEMDEKIMFLAKAFGFEIIWNTPAGSIAGIPSFGRGPRTRGGPSSVARKHGIPSVTLETGGEGKLDKETVELTRKGIINAMIHLDMLEGEKVPDRSRVLTGGYVIFARRGGLFMNKIKSGDEFVKGQVLGELYSLSCEVVETFIAPVNGFITNMSTLGAVNPGDMLYVIANTD